MRSKGFDALKALKVRIAEVEPSEEETREEQERRENDRKIFAEEMSRLGVGGKTQKIDETGLFEREMAKLGVTRLDSSQDTVVHQPKRVRAEPQRTAVKIAAEVDLSDSFDDGDPDDWGDREYVAVGCGVDLARNLSRGLWPVGAYIDLHGCRTDEARRRLSEFIREARNAHIRCVRIVHGKGINSGEDGPVLKGLVRCGLRQMHDVQAYVQAAPGEGGSGAVIVLLAKKF